MAVLTNGNTNGQTSHGRGLIRQFSEVPAKLEVPIYDGDAGEAVELAVEELPDDPTELCTLLANENVSKSLWITTAMAYVTQSKFDEAVDIINQGIQALGSGNAQDRLQLHSSLCWLHLMRSRRAPRIKFGTADSNCVGFP